MSGEPFIQLASGACYYFGKIECPGLDLEQDVIQTLAHMPRFGSKTRLHRNPPRGYVVLWSVAAHEVACMLLARALGYSPEVQWMALHHDDGEALSGDFPAPMVWWLRQQGTEVTRAINTLRQSAQTAVVDAWKGRKASDVAKLGDIPESLQIKRVDLALLEGERRVFMAMNGTHWITDDLVSEEDAAMAEGLVRGMLQEGHNFGAHAADEYRRSHAEVTRLCEREATTWPWRRDGG